jgi:hypothetical protein
LVGFHPPPSISWLANPPPSAPPDSRPNLAAFHPPQRFSLAAYPLSCPTRSIGSAADYRPILTGFCPATINFGPPGPASAPLSTGANGERRIHSVAELGRPNTIYMSSGPSGPIFMFLIQFEFYPTKRSRFEKISPPMFLEFHLVFLHNFSRFFIFFEISEFQFKKLAIFKIGPDRSRWISVIFRKIGWFFKPWLGWRYFLRVYPAAWFFSLCLSMQS